MHFGAAVAKFSGDPEVQKAAAEFDHAQKLEETFLKDFEGQDFSSRSLEDERQREAGIPLSDLPKILRILSCEPFTLGEISTGVSKDCR